VVYDAASLDLCSLALRARGFPSCGDLSVRFTSSHAQLFALITQKKAETTTGHAFRYCHQSSWNESLASCFARFPGAQMTLPPRYSRVIFALNFAFAALFFASSVGLTLGLTGPIIEGHSCPDHDTFMLAVCGERAGRAWRTSTACAPADRPDKTVGPRRFPAPRGSWTSAQHTSGAFPRRIIGELCFWPACLTTCERHVVIAKRPPEREAALGVELGRRFPGIVGASAWVWRAWWSGLLRLV
jgi:hypothetical protein